MKIEEYFIKTIKQPFSMILESIELLKKSAYMKDISGIDEDDIEEMEKYITDFKKLLESKNYDISLDEEIDFLHNIGFDPDKKGKSLENSKIILNKEDIKSLFWKRMLFIP